MADIYIIIMLRQRYGSLSGAADFTATATPPVRGMRVRGARRASVTRR